MTPEAEREFDRIISKALWWAIAYAAGICLFICWVLSWVSHVPPN